MKAFWEPANFDSDANEVQHALIASHRMLRRDLAQANEINATLEMQAKRDAAEISMLKTRIRSMAQTNGRKKRRR